MADGPSHFVLLEDEDGVELRRLGPMHLGRAHQTKHKYDNNPSEPAIARIIDNDNFDPETGQEKPHVDTDKEGRRDPSVGRSGTEPDEGDSAGREGQPD